MTIKQYQQFESRVKRARLKDKVLDILIYPLALVTILTWYYIILMFI
jgi:type II secretory pathway component PulF